MNLEWSHTNDWTTVDNIGANPGEALTDNVWSFIRASYQMMYRGRDESRLSEKAYQNQVKLYDPSYIRAMRNPNATLGETDGDVFAETMRRNGITAPQGSKLFLKANFTADNYESLLNNSRDLGMKYTEWYQPDACKEMTPLQRRGVDAFEQGIDYLPEIPVYGNADKTAGFVFGNNIVIGAMQVRVFFNRVRVPQMRHAS